MFVYVYVCPRIAYVITTGDMLGQETVTSSTAQGGGGSFKTIQT